MIAEFEDWGASAPAGVGASFLPECDSTNAVASKLGQSGETGPLWIVAGRQSAGRGRRGKIWKSEGGNLYASLLFKPAIEPSDMTAIPFLVALAVRDTFLDFGADDVRCKWPNDVLIGGHKASGVLIESSARNAKELDYVIIGIGINLMHFPNDAQFRATSLKAVTGNVIDVRHAFQALSHHLFDRLTNWKTSEITPIAEEWTNSAWGLGHRCVLRTATDTFEGTPLRLAGDGGLVVGLDNGEERSLYAGDIFPVGGME
ncbi:biotin--[acetyl-CoA-carboxylase] ligase [Kordiimonas sp.]|uniref:biotin--[acetyl-CoA-carboxylase] ligase n=1 Tax=Kordiimonas sp. TaxID=1970157 RepID=UPI003A95458B